MNDERHSREHVLTQQREQDAIPQYVEGYRQQPEMDDDVAFAQQISEAVLTQEPWA